MRFDSTYDGDRHTCVLNKRSSCLGTRANWKEHAGSRLEFENALLGHQHLLGDGYQALVEDHHGVAVGAHRLGHASGGFQFRCDGVGSVRPRRCSGCGESRCRPVGTG